jgi:hypothetical protein
MMLTGKRQEAVQAAADAGLWAHALIIAGHVNKEVYDQIIQRFTESNVALGDPLRTILLLFGNQASWPGRIPFRTLRR